MGSIRPATLAVLAASTLVVGGLSASAVLGLPGAAQAQDPPYDLPTPTPTAEPPPRPRLLTPSPVIGIRGKLTLNGARLSALRVTTPPLVRIVVQCKGAKRLGCPRPRSSYVVPDSVKRSVTYRLKRYERSYRAGVVLEVGVARRGTVGRYSAFTIRKGRFPQRRDGCANYDLAVRRSCPSD